MSIILCFVLHWRVIAFTRHFVRQSYYNNYTSVHTHTLCRRVGAAQHNNKILQKTFFSETKSPSPPFPSFVFIRTYLWRYYGSQFYAAACEVKVETNFCNLQLKRTHFRGIMCAVKQQFCRSFTYFFKYSLENGRTRQTKIILTISFLCIKNKYFKNVFLFFLTSTDRPKKNNNNFSNTSLSLGLNTSVCHVTVIHS